MTSHFAAVGQKDGNEAPVVHTAHGDLCGVRTDGVTSFHAVPYAAPPVGELRFAPAAPLRPWHGLRDATRPGPVAPQLPSRLAAVVGDDSLRPQDEDCLTLSIRTPGTDGNARPVLVWFHGGAWMAESGSGDKYDGSNLAREGGLVFVGVNYRLGALGWLHRPGIVETEPGLSDMIAALAWVHDHIADFGGDPNEVTVMGQSAGATSIARLLMLPGARGLFRRVIMQSSGLGRGFRPSATAAALADQFLGLVDIDPEAGDALIRLRAMEVGRLLRAQGELTRSNARFAETAPPFMPVVPAAMTQTDMLAAIAEGVVAGNDFGKIDVLIGTTAEEVHAFYSISPLMRDPKTDAVITAFGGEAMHARYRMRRPGATALDLLADLGTDEVYLRPAVRFADAVAERGGKVHVYLFDWAPAISRFKSCHCIELPFVFGTLAAWSEAPMLAGGEAAQMADLSKAIRQAWIAFARDGVPGHDALPPWSRYEPTRRPTMRFGARIGIVHDPAGFGDSLP